MVLFVDRVVQKVTSTGNGATVTLAASAESGYRNLASAVGASTADLSYVIVDDANFEIGVGQSASGGASFTRTTVEISTNSNARIVLSGTATLMLGASAEMLNDMVSFGYTQSPTTPQQVVAQTNLGGTTVGRAVFAAASAAAARTALVAQADNANLTALAGLTFAADQFPFSTGPGAMAVAAVTNFARQILDDANGAAVWATLGGAGVGATNGYFKLPNGLMVQWGRAASVAADFVITFPTAFPAALYSLVATPSYLAGATELVAVTTASQTRLQFSAYRRFTAGAGVSGTAAPEVWWIATGV